MEGDGEIHSRLFGTSRYEDSQPEIADKRIKVFLLSTLVTNPEELMTLAKDSSCHRSTIVRSENLPVYVFLEKAFVEQDQYNLQDIEKVPVEIMFRDSRSPAPIGRYFPSSIQCCSKKAADIMKEISDPKSMQNYTVKLPDGSICYVLQIMVGEGAYNEIHVRLELPPRTLVNEMISLDIDDLNVFKSATPAGNFLKSLSRNEYSLQDMDRRCYYSTLIVEVVEPVQVGWDRHSLHSSIFWSIRIRNRLKDDVIVVRRFTLLFDRVEETLTCFNGDLCPISLQPDEVYCFVYSVVSSCQQIPIASLLLNSEAFCSSIIYQVQLIVPDKEMPWLNMCLECPSEVTNHSTFAVGVTITNVGQQTIPDLEISMERPSTKDEPVIKPYLCLDKCVKLGTVSTGQTATANLHFLALREGVISLSNIIVQSKTSGKKFVQEHALTALITRNPT